MLRVKLRSLGRAPAVCGAVAALSIACNNPPEDLRTWKPSDHTNAGSGQGPNTRQVSGVATSTVAGLDEVTIAAWRANCSNCHGSVGRGDGPQSPMYKPRDLSDPAWQGSVTDEQITQVIQNGKGKMPGFALPEKVAQGLTSLVRLMNQDRRRAATPGGSAAASATGPASSGRAPAAAGAPARTAGTVPTPARSAAQPRASASPPATAAAPVKP